MIHLQQRSYSLVALCEFVGISPQAFYKRCKSHEEGSALYSKLEALVLKERISRSRAGLRVIYYKNDLGTELGLNQFEQEMSFRGLALRPYRSYQKTTDSRGHAHKYPNLISGMDLQRENHVIVGDISYYESRSKRYYIIHFIDYYTLEIKGLLGSTHMLGIIAEKCLRQVYSYNKRSTYGYKLIIHTDGGGQYRSDKFQAMLRKAKIRPSQAKNCLENGLSERANGIVKNEYLVDYDIRSERHLNTVLKEIKRQVNEVWPSAKLGYKTPKAYAEQLRQLKAAERPVKRVKEVE